MRSTLIAILFLTAFPVAEALAENCSISSIQTQAKQIALGYQKYDMSMEIDSLTSRMQRCKIPSRRLGVPETFYPTLRTQTLRAEFNRIQVDMEQYANTGRINEFVEAYTAYGKALGFPPNILKSFTAGLKAKAEKSYAREKQSCKPMDVSKEMGPVRNQDSIGWCYAFAAADVLSFKLKKKISAADIAVNYNDSLFNTGAKYVGVKAGSLEGGFPSSALEGAIEKGLCLEKDFPSEDNINGEFQELITQIDKLGRDEITSWSAPNCEKVYQTSRRLFPNVSTKDLEHILKTSSRADFIDQMANRTCKQRIKTDLKVSSPWTFREKSLGDEIDEQLSAKNPVVLSYDAQGLGDRRDYSQLGMHASVLVGRRFNEKSGQCEYLLRNSWGRSCGYYDPSYQCKEGNIWIPKADIVKRGKGATYVK
ncbi:C1 family peptidase [Bdellovibrio bacteriovorus]|uniref:C1 family peptidase n=1 Tax=Bdellovibrio bacteriovorus TaxID=959 RepID=UPI0035A64AB4